MNELQIFKNAEFGEVRVVELGGEPWFVGKDIAEKLGYTNTKDALVKHVDMEDKRILKGSDLRPLENHIPKEVFSVNFVRADIPNRGLTIINESGVHALILSSKLPKAKEFKHWVTSEVLPAIRKHGGYLTAEKIQEALLNPDTIINLAQQLKAEQEKNKELHALAKHQEKLLDEAKDKVSYFDIIMQNKGLVAISQIAKDYGMSGREMNKKLHELKIQYKVGKQWVLYSKYQNKGYVSSKTFYIDHKDGAKSTHMETYWTQKGRHFIYEDLKKIEVLPMIEREDI